MKDASLGGRTEQVLITREGCARGKHDGKGGPGREKMRLGALGLVRAEVWQNLKCVFNLLCQEKRRGAEA